MNKNIILTIIFLVAFGCFVYVGDSTGYLYDIPKVGRYFQAYKYDLVSLRYSPEDIQYKRLKAMSQALKDGKDSYTYRISGPQAQAIGQ